jgi:Fic family protein
MKNPYIPEKLPPKSIDWSMHIKSIEDATIAIGKYDGVLQGIANPYVFLSPLIVREAMLSSQIEGTQVTLEEILQYEAVEGPPGPEKRDDLKEVSNYRKAMSDAIKLIDQRPLCINTICNIHRVLLSDTRGKDKNPGEIRTRQNYIGTQGTDIGHATFVPPEPQLVMDAFSDWEKYLHSDGGSRLVQMAILKAQFELIHPFLDGNGRIGRMLVPLILYYKKVLSRPTFYISSYLEQNKIAYKQRLSSISENNDWNGWVTFFLKAVVEQSKENSSKAMQIIDLNRNMNQMAPKIISSKYSTQAIEAIFSSPIFDTIVNRISFYN